MTHTYNYEQIYYGGEPYDPNFSKTLAPTIIGTLFSINAQVTSTQNITLCLDTGADDKTVIPQNILDKLGVPTDVTNSVGYDGVTSDSKTPVYAIGLRINQLNYEEVIQAIPTLNTFGFLARSVMNDWTVALNPRKGTFTITT